MSWVKRKEMQSEESGICDGVFEGSVIVYLVVKKIVVESGIRDGFLNLCDFLCFFVRVRVKVYLMHVKFTARDKVGVRCC